MDPAALALIAITDDLRDGVSGLRGRALAAVRGGATMLQVRLKHASPRELVEVTRALVALSSVPVVVNDRADIALAAGAAGVHVGTDDLPTTVVRRMAPPGFIVGASFGGPDERAHAEGADYVGIGPVFPTGSKPDAGEAIGLERLQALVREAGVPAVAIGGITVATAGDAVAAGASGVAVIRAIFAAPDPEEAARALREAVDRRLHAPG